MRAFSPPNWLLVVLAVGAFLSSCTVFEPGIPAAAITVTGRSESEVQETVDHVFTEDGYHVASRGLDTLTFERPAGKVDRVVYGNWLEGQVSQRVRVVIAPHGEGKYRVRCLPSVVRDAGDTSFEDEQRRVLLYSYQLSKLLKEVQRQQR